MFPSMGHILESTARMTFPAANRKSSRAATRSGLLRFGIYKWIEAAGVALRPADSTHCAPRGQGHSRVVPRGKPTAT